MSALPGDDFRAFVEGEFQRRFAAAYPAVPVQFHNAEFKQPKTDWGAFFIMPGKSFKASLGRSRFVERTPGLIQIDMLQPAASGHTRADQMAEAAARFFANADFSIQPGHVARFRGPEVRPLGVHAGFYRVSARVVFEHDFQIGS